MKKYAESSFMIQSCVKAKKTVFYDFLQEMYEKGYFIGKLLNNNFDRIPTRYGIEEQQLRVYEYENYLPKIEFDPKAKALFCIGTHADRRKIQKQARENNLQIIYVDLEGFETEDGFEPYPIEGAREGDIVFKMSASDFALLMKKDFLNNNKELVK
ncbi:MAG TPA: hypothetical protein GX747_03825 [Tenericutes bacterium]|nr:hypothetical protein [Mycoplasmatota bacterium]